MSIENRYFSADIYTADIVLCDKSRSRLSSPLTPSNPGDERQTNHFQILHFPIRIHFNDLSLERVSLRRSVTLHGQESHVLGHRIKYTFIQKQITLVVNSMLF